MADYQNGTDVTFTVTAKIFGPTMSVEAEETAVKDLLIQAIENLNILDGQSNISIKVTDCTEEE